MASGFSLQKPFVVASLPKPIGNINGRYVYGDVYGGAPGSKRRKRSELVLGVDGEGVNLYDISASRLITSYALPPQTSFTCHPTSIRIRPSKGRIERRTYVSTFGQQAQITLFRDFTNGKSTNQTSTTSKAVASSKATVVFLGTTTPNQNLEVSAHTSDLLLLKEDGEIQCLDGDNLEEKWTSPASALGRDAHSAADTQVEFAQLTNAYTAKQGLLKGHEDVFTLFPQEVSDDGFNPDILVVITKSVSTSTRNIHIIGLPRRAATLGSGTKQSVETLISTKLPYSRGQETLGSTSYNLQVSAGTIQQLSGSTLTTFDLTKTIPSEVTSLKVGHANSFLRLSNTSVMVSGQNNISVFNPKYQSVLASIQLDGTPATEESRKRKRTTEQTNGDKRNNYNLVSYYPKLSTVVAIVDNELLAIQIEGKSRATGLLIDSLGCAIRDQARSGRTAMKSEPLWLTGMDDYLHQSVGAAEKSIKDQSVELELAVTSGDAVQFDKLMAEKLGDFAENPSLVKGPSISWKDDSNDGTREAKQTPPKLDRRWVIFALSKIFAWTKDKGEEYRLTVPLYPPNVFMGLLRTGNMTTENIECALRNDIRLSGLDNLPSGELVNAIVELNRDMELLLVLISRNLLGAAELLTSIRVLMDSLELFGDSSATKQQLLTNGESDEIPHEDIDIQVEELEEEAAADLALAEYQLGPGSGIRGEALSLALSKLYTCPADTIVFALQTTFSSQEIVSLIYLLRFELATGAWTSRYLDFDMLESFDEEISDNSIILISSLLNNCIDSIGAGGWISGDARLVNGDPFEAEELIASLKLEVSAALEGIEEATYLKGLMSEMIRYGDSFQKGPDGVKTKKRKVTAAPIPIILPSPDENISTLPLGLRVDERISLFRIGAGGEVQERSMRDIGRLKSQRVGEYSRERIVI